MKYARTTPNSCTMNWNLQSSHMYFLFAYLNISGTLNITTREGSCHKYNGVQIHQNSNPQKNLISLTYYARMEPRSTKYQYKAYNTSRKCTVLVDMPHQLESFRGQSDTQFYVFQKSSFSTWMKTDLKVNLLFKN